MIKNRHFMLGLGVGLIIGALLLQIMMIGQGPTTTLATIEQVQRAAAELNLKVVDVNEELLTEDQWKAKTQDSVDGEEESVEGATQSHDQPASPTSPTSPEVPDKPQSEPSTSTSETTKVDELKINSPDSPAIPEPAPVLVEYRIRSGATLANVASGLKKAGIISDEQSFIKKASAKGVNRKLQVGTYKFAIGEDYNSIISKISIKSSSK